MHAYVSGGLNLQGNYKAVRLIAIGFTEVAPWFGEQQLLPVEKASWDSPT